MTEGFPKKPRLSTQKLYSLTTKLIEKFSEDPNRLDIEMPYFDSKEVQKGDLKITYTTLDYDRPGDGPAEIKIVIKTGDLKCEITTDETDSKVILKVNKTDITDKNLIESLLANVERSVKLKFQSEADKDAKKSKETQKEMGDKIRGIL